MNNISTVNVSAQNKTKSYIPHLADLYYAEFLTQEIELPSSQGFAFKQIFAPKIRERCWVCFCYFVTLFRNKKHKNNVLRVGGTLIFFKATNMKWKIKLLFELFWTSNESQTFCSELQESIYHQ